MTLFKNRVFQIELFKRRSSSIRVGLNPMTGVLTRRCKDKKPSDNKGKDCYDATARQGMQTAKSHQKLRGGKEGISASRQHCLPNTCTSMQPQELWENQVLLFYATMFAVICYGSPTRNESTFCQSNHYHLLRFYHLNNDQRTINVWSMDRATLWTMHPQKRESSPLPTQQPLH